MYDRPMNDVYSRLARKLDTFPNGFPSTESGIELRILKHIFSPEDARMALALTMVPESASAISGRVGLSAEETKKRLDDMADEGQIFVVPMRGKRRYMLAPFVVGIYEFQLRKMTPELAEMFEEYAPELLKVLGGTEPALARVIPVNKKIQSQAAALPYDDLRLMLEKAKSFRVADCICREEQAALGSPCTHTSETCLSFSRARNAYDDVLPGYGRVISREEALEILDRCEDEGLVHCTYNVQEQNMFVCNCCSCCCGFLRGVKEFDAPHMLMPSGVVARIESESCVSCGVCAEKRCPMEAIVPGEEAYEVIADRCIGCGVCVLKCPTDSISMVPRKEQGRMEPPKDLVSWSYQRQRSQIGRLRTMARFAPLGLRAARSRRDTRD